MFHGIMFIYFQGTFLLNQALARALVSEKMKPASLVNISSIVGKVSRVESLPVKLVQRSYQLSEIYKNTNKKDLVAPTQTRFFSDPNLLVYV